MGGTSCKGTPNSNKAITIAILGLDNAGKTTTVQVLEKAPVDNVAPTIGFSQSEITHKNEKIKLIDLGGAKTFREAWRHYYDDAYGFVYVLDSSEEDRFGENRDVLKKLLQEEKVKGKPILILANKQDKPEALDKNSILEDLKIERLVNEHQTLCRVELCSAKATSRNGKNAKIDESIRHGFDWLIKTVYDHYEVLHKRVDEDVRKRNEIEQKEKRERQERVRKIREEREKEEGTKATNDEVDEDTTKKGFVPIGQAVKNAERNLPEKSHKEKHKSTSNENTSLPPIPAPRSSSRNRTLLNDDNSDDQERPRRFSTEVSPRRKESPVPRSVSSNFEETETNNSTDEQSTIRSTTGKKKKVVGPNRNRLHGDSLPPLAPSSAASRREDFPLSRGPPVGTPRPQPLVAQWAITSPAPQSTADKLTTITSDNELDRDEDRYKSYKSNKRTTSPHPNTTNRVVNGNQNQSKTIHTHINNDDDDDDEIDDYRKRTHSEKRSQKNKFDDNDNNSSNQSDSGSNRRVSSSTRKTTNGYSSHRSNSRTSRHRDDDD